MAAACWILLGAPALASLVKECCFLTLWRGSGSIFHGRCIARKEFPDGQPLPYTEYTFQVLEAVKGCRSSRGEPLETVTFRHAGTTQAQPLPGGLEAAPLRLGLPDHAVGEEMVLFLTRESSAGLCAPVGLTQGKFPVMKKNRRPFVENRRGKQLFREVGESAFLALRKEESDVLRQDGREIELRTFLNLCARVKE